MSKSCQGLLKELVHCVREEDCMKIENRPIKDCTRESTKCAGLRTSYFNCKRGQIDPRSRIQGNKGF